MFINTSITIFEKFCDKKNYSQLPVRKICGPPEE